MNQKSENGDIRMALTITELGKYSETAEVRRNRGDAARHKHLVFGLVFHKYVIEAFQKPRQEVQTEWSRGVEPAPPVGARDGDTKVSFNEFHVDQSRA